MLAAKAGERVFQTPRRFALFGIARRIGGGRTLCEQIGQGYVGLETFRMLLNDARFADRPMLLETPKDDDLSQDVQNLALLRSLLAQPGR